MYKGLLIIGVSCILLAILLKYIENSMDNIHLENGEKKLIVETTTYVQDSQGNLQLVSHWTEEKFNTLKKLAENGNNKAQVTLGHLYLNGEFVRTDLDKAAFWFEQSAVQGNSLEHHEAQFNLGYTYEKKGDITNAIKWYTKAAENNYSDAQLNLGLLYENQKNYEMAREWYKRAVSSHNDGGAQYYLALLLYDESHSNVNEVIALLKEALYRMNTLYEDKAKIEYSLGWLYLNDESVRNTELGLQYLKSSTDKGEPEAEFLMGELYEEGEILPKDLKEAKVWYTRAALRDMPKAIEKLKEAQFK